MVYFDHIAATPLDPRVFEAMQPYFFESYGSPLSLHRSGMASQKAIETARQQVATLIGARPDEIVFTSNGTEANNFALKGMSSAYEKRGRHIVVSSIEHHSVLYALRSLERQGFQITHLKVDACGTIDPDQVRQAIQDDTILVSVMHASDEIGTIQPVREICQIAHEHGVSVHTDAICTAGVIPVDVNELGVDTLSLTAQHMSGPQGAGALYIRQGSRIRPLMDGGIQEDGRRGGQENIPAIVGFGVAAELALLEMSDRNTHVSVLYDRLLTGLTDRIGEIRLNGHPQRRLPGHLSLTVREADSESMVLMLDAQDIAVSMGSSCSSHASKPSHVLLAIGLTPREAQSTVLITLGYTNTDQDIECLLHTLPDIVDRLRQISGTGNN